MLRFKQIDFIIQLLLIITVPLVFFITKNRFQLLDFTIGYFIVGGWQLISVVIHFFFPRSAKIRLRSIHGLCVTILGIVCIALAGMNNDGLINFLIFVLAGTPILAILYLITCYKETKLLTAQAKKQKDPI